MNLPWYVWGCGGLGVLCYIVWCFTPSEDSRKANLVTGSAWWLAVAALSLAVRLWTMVN